MKYKCTDHLIDSWTYTSSTSKLSIFLVMKKTCISLYNLNRQVIYFEKSTAMLFHSI